MSENIEDMRRFLSRSIEIWDFSLKKSETLVANCDFFQRFLKESSCLLKMMEVILLQDPWNNQHRIHVHE